PAMRQQPPIHRKTSQSSLQRISGSGRALLQESTSSLTDTPYESILTFPCPAAVPTPAKAMGGPALLSQDNRGRRARFGSNSILTESLLIHPLVIQTRFFDHCSRSGARNDR